MTIDEDYIHESRKSDKCKDSRYFRYKKEETEKRKITLNQREEENHKSRLGE
jgi:hypothetical protein